MAITEYQIDANTKRCAVTGKELPAGDQFFTAIFDENGKFVRRDYCHQAWHGPPAGAFSFWSGRVPPPDPSRRPRIDDDLLMDCFQRLEGQVAPDRLRFRYAVALLLMRRKRLKFDEARTAGGEEILSLRCARTRILHEVVNPRLTEEDMVTVQDEVFKALGWD